MVAIKDMEMPKACYRCPLLDGEYGTCNIDGIGETEIDMTEERASDCPLVEIEQTEDCVSLKEVEKWLHQHVTISIPSVETQMFEQLEKELPRVTPTQSWTPLVWDEYPTVDMDGNDDYVYAVDYSVPMPKEDEWVLITDENHNVRTVQYDGYDFGDYVREHILAWAHLPMPYKD